MKQNKKGFTLIELLVVIAIIGLLSTLAVVALNNAREKSRDAKRVADVKQMQTALELYFNDCGQYPLGDGTTKLDPTMADGCGAAGTTLRTYLAQVPTNPAPMSDGTCAGNDYLYTSCDASGATCDGSVGVSYIIEYCLGAPTGNIAPGQHFANPASMGE